MTDIKVALLLWLIHFFDKKSKVSGVNMASEFNKQLAEKLHKPIIRKFKKITVYSRHRDNIWGVD